MSSNFTFHVFISLIIHELVIMLFWSGRWQFRYSVYRLRRSLVYHFLISRVNFALFHLTLKNLIHNSFRKFSVRQFWIVMRTLKFVLFFDYLRWTFGNNFDIFFLECFMDVKSWEFFSYKSYLQINYLIVSYSYGFWIGKRLLC